MHDMLARVSTLLFIVSMAFFAHAWRGWRAARKVAEWPSTPGRIVSARTLRGPQGDEYPSLMYEYAVHDKKYVSDTMWPLERAEHTLPGDADYILSKYSPDMTVEVFYDPGAPDSSFLERRKGRTTSWVTIVGIVTLAGSIAAAVYGALTTFPAGTN